ncbi:MAG: CDP-alcohol phosphatidyltransferase family protein [Lachnospiraceae bacterium]|nr:CDP-alcohol phosphatidyltransferase family protein [Lachnospiraceae bacterium]
MLGFYDYSVWLTYMSLISATIGIGMTIHGAGHPYWGVFFLMISGFCDAFDGRVARTKKDRTETQKKFGIQIDSLSDLVAFGVLPVCIGYALVGFGRDIEGIYRIEITNPVLSKLAIGFAIVILIVYVLAAMIRLAYFNVIEEERQETEVGCRKTYIGLPVTSAALIFPTILLMQYVIPIDISIVYYWGLLITACLFLSRIKVAKPGLRGIFVMVGVGVVIAILLLAGMLAMSHLR